jgi:hypothetical protein
MSTPLTNRKINLLQATAINMIDMVGIGPFVVMPLVVVILITGYSSGPGFGAVIAFMDGMVWVNSAPGTRWRGHL